MSDSPRGLRRNRDAPGAPPWVSRERFAALVEDAIGSIPADLRKHMENVTVLIEDEPDLEILRDLGLHPDTDVIFGLFEGRPLSEQAQERSVLPERIVIYYLPLTDEFRDEYHLRREIRRTVVHEVGHYFGFDDRQLRRRGF